MDAEDTVFKHHLQTQSSRATYISKTVQKELISCCGYMTPKVNLIDRGKRDIAMWAFESSIISQKIQTGVQKIHKSEWKFSE